MLSSHVQTSTMKITYLLVGLLIGGTTGFFLTKAYYQTVPAVVANRSPEAAPTLSSDSLNSTWPDSLDAVAVAPNSHKVVYEDSTVRILQVMLEANKTEPVHTHRWKSVMWFAESVPMTYYKNSIANNNMFITDSFSIPQMPPEVLNRGEMVDAEGPHSVKNEGAKDGIAYRVEFKQP